MFRIHQNTSDLLAFSATRHFQGNPRPSLITEIRLTCTAALKILRTKRLICTTIYLYFAFKVRNLPSSAEALQRSCKLDSTMLSNTNILQHLKAIYCKALDLLSYRFCKHNWRLGVSSPVNRLGGLTGSPHAENADGRGTSVLYFFSR